MSDIQVPPGQMTLRDCFRFALHDELERRGLTQAEFARRTGLTPKHINQLLSGKAFTSPEAWDYFAGILGMRWSLDLIPNGGGS